jgi:isocitrate dehydrogenase (NAD+)
MLNGLTGGPLQYIKEKNMAKHVVTLIPGDGIGLETTTSMRQVVEASGAEIEWEIAEAGEGVMEKYGTPLPDETLETIKKNKVAIKGPITTPVGTGFRSVNVALRKSLNLFACLRPVLSIPGAGARYDDVDLVIVRENTEDLYAGIEFEEGSAEAKELIEFCAAKGAGTIRPDSGISIKPISISASERIVKYACDYAVAHNRKKVTAAHKANIMKYSDGLFLHTAQDTAKAYEGKIEFDDRIIDAFCMNMVIDPSQFDVIVFPNLYGDIASDLCAGLVGGLGLAPGANIGEEYAVFEPVHGSAPKHAGKNRTNPTAQILSAAMMLNHLGEDEKANKIRTAIKNVYAKGEKVTYDIRRATGSDLPPVSTTEYTEALIQELKIL